jgi:hypothetical protein
MGFWSALGSILGSIVAPGVGTAIGGALGGAADAASQSTPDPYKPPERKVAFKELKTNVPTPSNLTAPSMVSDPNNVTPLRPDHYDVNVIDTLAKELVKDEG